MGVLLALGYGYVATALARRLTPQGWRVFGATRSGGEGRLQFDGRLAGPDLREAAAGADAILASIPPDEEGDPAFRALEPVLRNRAPLAWTGYLSTTGVYGDLAGRWAFEWSPVRPSSQTSLNRVRAEAQWLSLPRPASLFRLPGIYGPGRSALDRLRAGDARRIVKPGQVFSRIHVDDIATALAASIARPHPGRIYHVCDDEPGPPQDVIAYASALLGVECPPEIPYAEAALSPMAQRFYADNKRVSNARAKAELGWRPRFTSYREGLQAILAEEGAHD